MPEDNRPNFLVFLTDQQRGDALGCSGNPHIRTPHLDRLAGQGARFAQAHTNNPICIPARASLISGCWGVQNKILSNLSVPGGCMDARFVTIPQILRREGYLCQAIGKMHFVPRRNHYGFDRMQLMEEVPGWRQDDEYLMYLKEMGFGHIREVHGVRRELYMQPQFSLLPPEHHGTNWVADRTIEFLRANAARPFFCMAGWIAPHPPWNVPESLAHEYDPGSLPLPRRCREELEHLHPFAKHLEECMELNGASDEKLRVIKAMYYTSVTMVDSAVGRILSSLDELGLAERTVVIFLSDHGEMLGDHWTWQKKLFYEASVRIPLIVRCPGRIAPGTVCDELVSNLDVVPTILEAAGLDYPGQPDLPGQSLLGLLDGRTGGREVLFGECEFGQHLMFMARTKRYKYVYTLRGGVEELFDLYDDPDEFRNVAGLADYQQVRRDLRGRLVDWLRRYRFEAALNGDGLRVTPADKPMVAKPNRQDAVWPKNLPADEADSVQSAEVSLRSVNELTYEVLGRYPREL